MARGCRIISTIDPLSIGWNIANTGAYGMVEAGGQAIINSTNSSATYNLEKVLANTATNIDSFTSFKDSIDLDFQMWSKPIDSKNIWTKPSDKEMLTSLDELLVDTKLTTDGDGKQIFATVEDILKESGKKDLKNVTTKDLAKVGIFKMRDGRNYFWHQFFITKDVGIENKKQIDIEAGNEIWQEMSKKYISKKDTSNNAISYRELIFGEMEQNVAFDYMARILDTLYMLGLSVKLEFEYRNAQNYQNKVKKAFGKDVEKKSTNILSTEPSLVSGNMYQSSQVINWIANRANTLKNMNLSSRTVSEVQRTSKEVANFYKEAEKSRSKLFETANRENHFMEKLIVLDTMQQYMSRDAIVTNNQEINIFGRIEKGDDNAHVLVDLVGGHPPENVHLLNDSDKKIAQMLNDDYGIKSIMQKDEIEEVIKTIENELNVHMDYANYKRDIANFKRKTWDNASNIQKIDSIFKEEFFDGTDGVKGKYFDTICNFNTRKFVQTNEENKLKLSEISKQVVRFPDGRTTRGDVDGKSNPPIEIYLNSDVVVNLQEWVLQQFSNGASNKRLVESQENVMGKVLNNYKQGLESVMIHVRDKDYTTTKDYNDWHLINKQEQVKKLPRGISAKRVNDVKYLKKAIEGFVEKNKLTDDESIFVDDFLSGRFDPFEYFIDERLDLGHGSHSKNKYKKYLEMNSELQRLIEVTDFRMYMKKVQFENGNQMFIHNVKDINKNTGKIDEFNLGDLTDGQGLELKFNNSLLSEILIGEKDNIDLPENTTLNQYFKDNTTLSSHQKELIRQNLIENKNYYTFAQMVNVLGADSTNIKEVVDSTVLFKNIDSQEFASFWNIVKGGHFRPKNKAAKAWKSVVSFTKDNMLFRFGKILSFQTQLTVGDASKIQAVLGYEGIQFRNAVIGTGIPSKGVMQVHTGNKFNNTFGFGDKHMMDEFGYTLDEINVAKENARLDNSNYYDTKNTDRILKGKGDVDYLYSTTRHEWYEHHSKESGVTMNGEKIIADSLEFVKYLDTYAEEIASASLLANMKQTNSELEFAQATTKTSTSALGGVAKSAHKLRTDYSKQLTVRTDDNQRVLLALFLDKKVRSQNKQGIGSYIRTHATGEHQIKDIFNDEILEKGGDTKVKIDEIVNDAVELKSDKNIAKYTHRLANDIVFDYSELPAIMGFMSEAGFSMFGKFLYKSSEFPSKLINTQRMNGESGRIKAVGKGLTPFAINYAGLLAFRALMGAATVAGINAMFGENYSKEDFPEYTDATLTDVKVPRPVRSMISSALRGSPEVKMTANLWEFGVPIELAQGLFKTVGGIGDAIIDTITGNYDDPMMAWMYKNGWNNMNWNESARFMETLINMTNPFFISAYESMFNRDILYHEDTVKNMLRESWAVSWEIFQLPGFRKELPQTWGSVGEGDKGVVDATKESMAILLSSIGGPSFLLDESAYYNTKNNVDAFLKYEEGIEETSIDYGGPSRKSKAANGVLDGMKYGNIEGRWGAKSAYEDLVIIIANEMDYGIKDTDELTGSQRTEVTEKTDEYLNSKISFKMPANEIGIESGAFARFLQSSFYHQEQYDKSVDYMEDVYGEFFNFTTKNNGKVSAKLKTNVLIAWLGN